VRDHGNEFQINHYVIGRIEIMVKELDLMTMMEIMPILIIVINLIIISLIVVGIIFLIKYFKERKQSNRDLTSRVERLEKELNDLKK